MEFARGLNNYAIAISSETINRTPLNPQIPRF